MLSNYCHMTQLVTCWTKCWVRWFLKLVCSESETINLRLIKEAIIIATTFQCNLKSLLTSKWIFENSEQVIKEKNNILWVLKIFQFSHLDLNSNTLGKRFSLLYGDINDYIFFDFCSDISLTKVVISIQIFYFKVWLLLSSRYSGVSLEILSQDWLKKYSC